jgi:tetratricopeptide (TPR) repeat protein
VREAVSSYEKCLALRHAHVEAKELYQLGCLYLQTQKYYEAADTFSRGCTFKSSAEMWLGLGKALFLRNELQQAETALAEANVMDSHNPEVWAWLALTALRSNNISEAQAAFTEAIKNNLELPLLYRDIGRGFLKAGQVAVAEQSIKRAIAMLPEDALCQKLLGDCLAEQVQGGGGGHRVMLVVLSCLVAHGGAGFQGKSCREVPNRAQCATAHRFIIIIITTTTITPIIPSSSTPLPGEDRKLCVKALAAILKALGLHHEAAAVVAKN